MWFFIWYYSNLPQKLLQKIVYQSILEYKSLPPLPHSHQKHVYFRSFKKFNSLTRITSFEPKLFIAVLARFVSQLSIKYNISSK